MKIAKHQQWRRSFPYYKVQFWDNKVSAWHDIQKTFSTPVFAETYSFNLNKVYRIIEINREGRNVL